MWRSLVHDIWFSMPPQCLHSLHPVASPSSVFAKDAKCLLFALMTWLYTIYIFLRHGYFLSYGHPLVPCCPDKRGFNVVHLFNLHSATRMDLAYGGLLCSSYRQLFEIPLRCSHLPVQSRHCHEHTAIKSHALSSNLLTNTTWVYVCLSGLLTILGILNKPSRGVSKLTTTYSMRMQFWCMHARQTEPGLKSPEMTSYFLQLWQFPLQTVDWQAMLT